MSELRIELPRELIQEIAERASDLVLARLPVSSPPRPYMSVAEAAEFLRAKPQRVYDLVSSGRLTRYKDGARVLVSRAELDAYLGGQRIAQAQVRLRKRK